MCGTSSFQTRHPSAGVRALHPDCGKRRRPPRPASLHPASRRAVSPFPLSQHGNSPARAGRLYSQSWPFCLAEGHIIFPIQTDQGAEAKAQAGSMGRHGTCAVKQERDIPLLLPSHMCARSISSTTSANFSKVSNLHFCLQHPRF